MLRTSWPEKEKYTFPRDTRGCWAAGTQLGSTWGSQTWQDGTNFLGSAFHLA